MTDKQRLDKHSRVCPETGCWLWTASTVRRGYGNMRFRGKNWRSHRISYVLYRGEIPEGFIVLHSCDIPACINPDHLSLGTHDENMRDMKRKGRQALGERVNLSKLTAPQVEEIRRRYVGGNMNHLAKEFGVSRVAVGQIIRKQTWRHVA